MNGRHCTACGAELAEGASFCTSCGARVETAAPSRCPSCGAEFAEGASFCTSCGAPVKTGAPPTTTPPPATPPPVSPAELVCPRCSAPNWDSVFCAHCTAYLGDPTGTVERATLTRRLFGDHFLEHILMLVTLGIGWFIWLIFAANGSQTPAKQLVSVYIIRKSDGMPASAGRVWLRDVLAKLLLLGLLGSMLYGLVTVLNYLWATWDKNRQALHDKIADTIVVYAPLGLPVDQLRAPIPGARAGRVAPRPAPPVQAPPAAAPAPPSHALRPTQSAALKQRIEELQRLKEEGILTEEEFERKRKEAVDNL